MEARIKMSQNNFQSCVGFIIDVQEGTQLTFDPQDPGGTTKFGISQRSHPLVNVEALTREQAEDIYYNEYWTPINLENIPAPLDLAIFDSAVNHGVNFAKSLQTIMDYGPISWEGVILFRMKKYWDLAFANKVTKERWFFGWIGRLTRLYAECARRDKKP